MSDEFKKIMDFFSLPAQEKAGHLKEVFEESVEFFEKFKYILQHGTIEEKRAMVEQVRAMQKKLQEETQRVKESTGLSDEQLQAFAENKQNFPPDVWETIQEAKGTISKQASEIASIAKPNRPQNEGDKPKPPKKKKTWVKS